jgi:methyltransferase (TIGR00027 family)
MRHDSPSDTSQLVARSILLASKDPDLARLVAPGEAALLGKIIASAGPAGWFDFVLERSWTRRVVFGVERAMVAGIIAHYLARKRWIEIQVRESLARGIRQVVVLGAGFDTLAARLAREFPLVLFLELDHPATQAVKRNMPEIAPNLQFLPVDLTTQSLSVDACPEFSRNHPSLIVAEGITMYLTADQVAAMLANSADLAGPGGRLIFTFMEQATDGSISFRGEHPWVAWWLKSRREPFLWGISRDCLPGWVEANGWGIDIIAGDQDLRNEILVPRGLGEIPLARGECLCSCSPHVR